METQFPFTPEGVQQWQTVLYALPVQDRVAEASLVSSDFKEWIVRRFALDQDQQDYLNSMPEERIVFAAEGVSFAVEHGLPVILDKPEKPSEIHVMGAKLDELEKKFGVSSNAGEPVYTGEFVARIRY